jgi:hydroxyethylthiazole kinase-like uncharacterized protein yjeF
MRNQYDVAQVQAAESVLLARLPDGALMQRAAAGLARTCAKLLPAVYGARVVLLVGSGNNGGDALYAGAGLARRGARVDAVLTADRVHDEALASLQRAGGSVASDSAVLESADLVVDGILGIGGHGGLRPPAAELAMRAASSSGPLVAVDVPSGVDASTGEVEGAAVRADVTVTFGGLKTGLFIDPGANYAGLVELVDIGLDLPPPRVEVLQAVDVAALIPRAGRESDKYRRGVVGVAAGSDQYTGAAVLCVGGAVRSGAGMVRYVGDDAPAALVRQRWPEAVIGEGRVQAWTVGSGGGSGAAERLATAVASQVPIVVDADALAAVRECVPRGSTALLTPHAGELARLLDLPREDVEARRLEHVQRAAEDLGVTVLLKGSTTIVAAPDGRVRVNPTGTPALATAGSGDVLAGLCGALLAGGLDPLEAGAVGAWLHGLAGRLAAEDGRSISAYDVVAALPDAFAVVER